MRVWIQHSIALLDARRPRSTPKSILAKPLVRKRHPPLRRLLLLPPLLLIQIIPPNRIPMRSVLMLINLELLLAHRLDQGGFEFRDLFGGEEVVACADADEGGGGEVFEVGGDGEEGGVVGDDGAEKSGVSRVTCAVELIGDNLLCLDWGISSTSQDGVSPSEAKPNDRNLATRNYQAVNISISDANR